MGLAGDAVVFEVFTNEDVFDAVAAGVGVFLTGRSFFASVLLSLAPLLGALPLGRRARGVASLRRGVLAGDASSEEDQSGNRFRTSF